MGRGSGPGKRFHHLCQDPFVRLNILRAVGCALIGESARRQGLARLAWGLSCVVCAGPGGVRLDRVVELNGFFFTYGAKDKTRASALIHLATTQIYATLSSTIHGRLASAATECPVCLLLGSCSALPCARVCTPALGWT